MTTEEYNKRQEEERERHRRNQLEELQRKNTCVIERSPSEILLSREIARIKTEIEREEYCLMEESRQRREEAYNRSLLGRIVNFFTGKGRKK